MKKVFIVFAVCGFYSASAQQKDIFDIQKHLQKKQQEDKPVDFRKYLRPPVHFQSTNSFVLPQADQTYLLDNGDRVIYGNGAMPCITTDMKQFSIMPNTGTKNELRLLPFPKLPEMIPNYILPLRNIAVRK